MPATATLAPPRRVTFLMQNSYGSGGIARTVVNLANAMAEHHDVEIISMFRWRTVPNFALDPRVTDTCLFDHSGGPRASPMPRDNPGSPARHRRQDAEDSRLYDGETSITPASLHTDRVLRRVLARMRPGVLVSTRPSLHLAASRWTPPWVVRVAQDHLNYPMRSRDPDMMATLDAAVRRMDAFVTLTFDDEHDYRRRWTEGRSGSTRVLRIPNASPFAPVDVVPRRASEETGQKVLLSAGRIERRKGFHRLIEAYAPLCEEFPDWRLDIYGSGPWKSRLKAQIDEVGASGHIAMRGYTHDFGQVLAHSDCYALSSTHEGLPMVLLEAQASGVPVVSFDCPRGPADLVHDGVDGRLVPDGDIAGLTAALRQVMSDPGLRASMGARGRENAEHYRIEAVVQQWETLFSELAAARRRPLRPRTTTVPRRHVDVAGVGAR